MHSLIPSAGSHVVFGFCLTGQQRCCLLSLCHWIDYLCLCQKNCILERQDFTTSLMLSLWGPLNPDFSFLTKTCCLYLPIISCGFELTHFLLRKGLHLESPGPNLLPWLYLIDSTCWPSRVNSQLKSWELRTAPESPRSSSSAENSSENPVSLGHVVDKCRPLPGFMIFLAKFPVSLMGVAACSVPVCLAGRNKCEEISHSCSLVLRNSLNGCCLSDFVVVSD